MTQPISRRSLARLPAPAGDDPVYPALAERNRLEAIHIAAIERVDDLFESGASEAERAAAEAEQDEACRAVCDYEREVLLSTVPTTKEGALTLLRFLGDNLRSFSGEDEAVAGAVAAIANFIEARI